jgi:hypothetical protein
MLTRLVLKASRVVAAIAALVFWFMPFRTFTQFLLCIGSLVIALICFGLSSSLDDTNTG